MDKFDLIPYVGVGEFHLGMTESDLIAIAGNPVAKRTNDLNETELAYPNWIFHLSADSGRVVEIGISDRVSVRYQDIDLFDDSEAFEKLLALDTDVRDIVGFTILRKLGIVLADFRAKASSRAVGIFAKGRWDSLLEKKNSETKQWE